MCASWNDKHDVGLLVRQLEATKKSSPGVATFVGVDFDDAIAVLRSSLNFAKGVSELEQTRILNHATLTVGAKSQITQAKLLEEIKRHETRYLKSPYRNFTLASSLSIRHFNDLRNSQIQGCRITFGRQLPKPFRGEHKQAIRRQFHLLANEIVQTNSGLNAHTSVRVAAKSKTDHEAALAAIDALNFLRGIWNFYLNIRQGPTFPPSIPRKPINRILIGPAHTVHKPSGLLSSDPVWFETSFQKSIKPYQMQKHWPDIKEFELHTRAKIKKTRYREDLENAFRRYNAALDLTDWNATFIQLWSLLEYCGVHP